MGSGGREVTGGRARRLGGLWWHRDFRLLWIGETVSKLGSNVTTVALPLVAVSVLNASTLMVGLITAAVWLPWLLVALPAGAWIDRLPCRPVMLVCDVVSAVLFVSVPVAAWLGVLTIGQLLVVAALTGVATVVFTTAYKIYLPALVSSEELVEGNAKLQGSESVAQVGGRGVAGLIAQGFGAVSGLLVDAMSFVVSTVCLVAIRAREPRVVAVHGSTTLRREIAEGLSWVWRDRYVRAMAFFGAVANLALTGYQAIQVVFLARVVGVGAAALGFLIAASGVGGVLGAFTAARLARWIGTARGLLVCLVGMAPFWVLIPLASAGPGAILAAVGGAALGGGVVGANVIIAGFRQSYPPPSMRGRVVATSTLVSNGTSGAGAVLAGAVGTVLGVRTTVWVLVGILFVAVLILLASPIRGRRDLPADPETAAKAG